MELSRFSRRQSRPGERPLWRSAAAPRLVCRGDLTPFTRCFGLVGLFDVVRRCVTRTPLRGAAPPGPFRRFHPRRCPRPGLWSKFNHTPDTTGTRRTLEGLLRDSGLEQVRILPLFRTLWPLARINALLGRQQEVEDAGREYRVAGVWNGLLRGALAVERQIFRASERGTGTSWLAIARTPADPAAAGNQSKGAHTVP